MQATKHIHSLALNILNLTFDHNIHLEVFWVGREYNKKADNIFKTIDFDDWYTTQYLINILKQRWGKISIDKFASDINRKFKRNLIQDIYARKQKAQTPSHSTG